jgi:hypothetical protein
MVAERCITCRHCGLMRQHTDFGMVYVDYCKLHIDPPDEHCNQHLPEDTEIADATHD